jgi:DNA-binding transcriptional LysR family regulator
MNTELLRTFLEVAKTRHFGHAAENLFLTQSAVSARVRQLEETIGTPLFTRERNNILLTPSGERLLTHAENMLVAWQVALQEVGVPSNQSIQLTLGATSNLWDTFLQSVLPKLSNQFPSLYIRTEIDSSQELTRALLGGRVDIAALLDPPTNMDLETRRISSLELMMVAHLPNMQVENIPSIGHVFVDWGTSFNLEQARLFDEPVAPILHTGQAPIALEFLLTHGGAAFLPTALVSSYLDRDMLHPICDTERASQDVYIVFSKKSEKVIQLAPIIAMLETLDIESEVTLSV